MNESAPLLDQAEGLGVARLQVLRADLAEKRFDGAGSASGVRMISIPEILLGINGACCVLLGARCLWLERELARRPPAPIDDGKATRVWPRRKPTVFHLRRKAERNA